MSGNTDILVIGGGIVGLSIALELRKRRDAAITVVDRQALGMEASWAAGGMLAPQAECELEGSFYKLCCRSRDLYPEFAAELLDETGVDIELDRTGTLCLAFSDDEAQKLAQTYQSQKLLGLSVESLSTEELIKLEPNLSTDVRSGLFFGGDWQVDNRLVVEALRIFANRSGITIIENTPVEELIVDGRRVTGARTPLGVITSKQMILAAGAWTSLISIAGDEMPFAVEPVRGQMTCYRPNGKLFDHVIYGAGGYVVPRRDGRVLAGSTTEFVGFEKDVTDDAMARIDAMARRISPSMAQAKIEARWSGLRPRASDELPIIGTFSGIDGLCIATAHYRNGILLAPATAEIVADGVLNGNKSDYLREFSPERFGAFRSAGGI